MEFTRKDVVRQPALAGGVAYAHLMSTKQPRTKRAKLLLHGMAGVPDYWVQWINLFVSLGGHPTYAPYYLSRERSSRVNIRSVHVLTYVTRIANYIKHVILPTHGNLLPDLVGHSMGGLVAQKLAEMGLANKVVLIAPAPPKGIRLRFGKDFIVPFRDYPAVVRSVVRQEPFVPSRKFLESLFVNPKKSMDAIQWCAELGLYESPWVIWELLNSSVEVDASKVTNPMLLFGFERDHIITVDVVRKIAGLYKQAELRVDKNLAHLCPLEYGWERIAKQCLAWLG